jgi:polysaccharide export outer membrane protein
MLATALWWFLLAPGVPQELPAQAAPATLQPGSADYRLGPADVLAVSVLGLQAFSQGQQPWLEVIVSNSGKIHVPYAGVIDVRDMTTAQLQSEIAKRLVDRDLVRDPQVTVRVMDYRGQTIYVLGEVLQPGQYYLRETTFLMDLIGLTQGFPTEGTAYLYRRSPVASEAPDGDAQADDGQTAIGKAIPIDIQGLLAGKRPDLNLQLQTGDVLYVPYNKPSYCYAIGEVNTPGPFEIPPSRPLLVSQAIAFAGGPTKTAKTSKGILVRWNEQGVREELSVDFEAILKGRKADFPVLPDDIIFIPGSNAKSLAYGLLDIVPYIAVTAVW